MRARACATLLALALLIGCSDGASPTFEVTDVKLDRVEDRTYEVTFDARWEGAGEPLRQLCFARGISASNEVLVQREVEISRDVQDMTLRLRSAEPIERADVACARPLGG